MQLRPLLPAVLLVAALLAGCAQQDAADAPDAITEAQAAQLFASAAENVPERFGTHLVATRDGTDLMTGDALFDGPANVTYFRMEMDESVASEMMAGAAMMGQDPGADLSTIVVYSSPDGSAIQLGDRVVVSGPDSPYEDMASEQDGLGAIADPEDLFGDLESGGFNVTSVTPTTLRGKAAYQIEATVEEDGATSPVTVWIFQQPSRIARLVMAAPDSGEEDDPFAGATMTMDMLYDDEVEIEAPAELERAIGLRYTSNASPFSYGGSSGEDEAIVWTFGAEEGTIPLAEVRLEVDGAPLLTLSEGTATKDGITATFTDADGDNKVSAGDTLRIEGANGAELALHDTVTGLKVVPGAGLLLAALALAGVALLLRRR